MIEIVFAMTAAALFGTVVVYLIVDEMHTPVD
jgi:hypothetical protein